MERCKFSLGFKNCLSVNCIGRGGGLALLWKKEVNLSVLSYLKSHIDAQILDDDVPNKQWFLTGIYGNPDATKRWET